MNLAAIPSPSQGVWHLGPVPIRAYALCIVLGIVAACVVTEMRMRRRGAPAGTVLDIAVWAVPAGIIGARIYHVLTSWDSYFGADKNPIDALKIWHGGLGVWGSVAGGAVGAWIACRRLGIPLTFVADALAPGLPLAQAIGRVGNWFNNELYGKATDLPWALSIYRWNGAEGRAATSPDGKPVVEGTFHPAFLYELLWDLGVALLVWLLDRRYRFGKGRAFALYVMAYTVGRFWIELLRIDDSAVIGGMRLNNWTAIIVFVGALVYFLRVKGPQEHLVIEADGVHVVPAGEAAHPEATETAEPAEAAEAAEPDEPDEPDDGGGGGADEEPASAPTRGTP